MIWGQYRIKDIALEVGSGTTPKSTVEAYYDGGTHEWVNTGDLNDDIVIESSTKVTDLAIEETSLRYFPKGTVIEAMYGATIGKVGLLSQPSTVNQACCAIVPNRKRINNRLLLYILRNYKSLLLRESFGGTQPNVNQHDVVVIPLTLPSLPDQNRIVAYLDEKTAAIDKQVSLLEQKKEKYALLKKSVIKQAVTKGLEGNSSNWGAGRLKEQIKTLESGKRPADEKEEVLSIGGEHIQDGNFYLEHEMYVSLATYNSSCGKISRGDILIVKDGATIGKCMYVDSMPSDKMLLNEHVYRIVASKYYYYYILSPMGQYWFRSRNMSSAQESIKQTTMLNLPVPLPPLSEQKAIADYLDEKCAKIDATIANIDQQIEKYKLLRRALINEVVTGQRVV